MEDTRTSFNRIKRLPIEALEELWGKFLADRTNKQLRDILIVQYIYLTRYVIGRIKVNLPPTYTEDDITSFALEGLIDGITKFDPSRGASFETYAITRIRGTIIDKIRTEDWVPRSTRKKMKEVREVQENLRKQLGRTPTSSEIGSVLGIEKEKVDAIMAENSTITSIYEKKGSADEGLEIIDTIEDSNSTTPLEQMVERDTKKELQQALASLPERERTIMILYYQKNMTLKEIGAAIEVSESRVCQLHAQAIVKLRNLLSDNKRK